MLTDSLINIAIAQAVRSKHKVIVYKYAKTIVITPDGYTIPKNAIKLGEVDRNGNFISEENSNAGIQNVSN